MPGQAWASATSSHGSMLGPHRSNSGLPTFFMGKASILREFWRFLRVRKKYWLAPIVVVLVVLSLLIVLTQGSALAPFIYSLF